MTLTVRHACMARLFNILINKDIYIHINIWTYMIDVEACLFIDILIILKYFFGMKLHIL